MKAGVCNRIRRSYGIGECLTLERTVWNMSKDVQSALRRLDITNRCN